MARPKKYADSGSFGVRFPTEILDSLNKYAKSRDKTRSEVVVNAVDNYIHGKQCIRCGAMNPAEGKHCAVCGADLFTYEEVKNAAIMISENEFENYISGDYQLLEKLPSLEKAGFEKEYGLTYAIFDEDSQRLYGFNRVMPTLWLRLKLKNTDSVISGENGHALDFSIDSKLLYAVLIRDSKSIAEISTKITKRKIENPSLSKEIIKRIPHNV